MTPQLFHVEHSEPLARFSPCRTYRYELWRRWADGPIVQFIGLNPSTADETQLDPTLRRVMRFAKDWGMGAFCMTNLFSFRATDPKVMRRAVMCPQDDENDRTILEVAQRAKVVVCAWGAHGTHLGRATRVLEKLFREVDREKITCLKLNHDGSPAHPLYLRADLRPTRFIPFG